MIKKLLTFYFLLYISNSLYAQDIKAIRQLSRTADSLYHSKQYEQAGDQYSKLIALSDFKKQKANAAYNAACCFALQHKNDRALTLLETAIENGYRNKSHLAKDNDLTELHSHVKWKNLLALIPEQSTLNDDPEQAKFVTADIQRFWQAYDLAQQDTNRAYDIYKQYYFDQASSGMDDYMGTKVGSIRQFVDHIQSYPKLYQSIRNNTLRISDYEKGFLASFQQFKEIYPDAKFPDVYFVIGALTSGGTATELGLLIGANQICKDEKTNLEELNFKQRLMINNISGLPGLIAHELIHFQQWDMARDTITLGYVITEGMADFMGELISGENTNAKIYQWTVGKEKSIWERFKKDMYFNRYSNWIANYRNVSDDSFPDLGYWIGYEICKSYYEQASDKKQAIYDMLHISDYKQFLMDSKWEEKIAGM